MVTLQHFCFTKVISKELNFQGVLRSKTSFGGYFEWNACIQFQKIWSWTRYDAFKICQNYLLQGICFKKIVWKVPNFQGFFTSKRSWFVWKACRGGSRTAATSKMEHFVIIVNGFQLLTIITKSSIVNVAAVLDPPLRYIT